MSLAFWDTTARAWIPVQTTLSEDRRTATAHVTHFSVWDDVYYWFGKTLTKRAGPPTCAAIHPKWVKATEYVQDRNNEILWCSGRDALNPDRLVVKAVNNRAFGVAIEPSAPPLTVHSSLLNDSGVEDLLKAGLTRSLTLPDTLRSLNGLFFLPPGVEITLTFDEQQVRGLEPGTLVRARMDPQWIIAGVMYDAVAGAVHDEAAAVLFTLVALNQCGHDLGHELLSERDLAAAAGAVVTCAAKEADAVVKTFIQLAPGKPESLPRTAVYLRRALLVIFAGQTGAQIGELISDMRTSLAVRAFYAYAVPPPLGSFAGRWWVHGTTLLISKNGKGNTLSNMGPCDTMGVARMCSERDLWTFTLSTDGTALTGTVTAVRFETSTGTTVPESATGASHVGDIMTLHIVRPGLLTSKWPLTYPLASMSTGDGGNPFWCAMGSANSDGLCGA